MRSTGLALPRPGVPEVCGVCGWFSEAPVAPWRRLELERMMSAIAHRGPDARGSVIAGNAALGHTRLAIIDLHAGQQPMVREDQGVSISFNGEIYNYRELRAGLTARGHVFRTDSDTEVILALYVAEGVQGFRQLRGMYAFALWDRLAARALLVRDVIGIKPLFIRVRPGELEFASEAKAILARSGERATLDEDALHLLMNFRYLPGERSLFKGVRQLAPGTVLEWTPRGTIQEHRLAEPPAPGGSVRDALEESVRVHLTADVEVGAYLSGGVDSAAVAAIASRHLTRPLRTFTLDVGDDPAEGVNAARTADLLGVSNTRWAVPNAAGADLRRLLWYLEVPKVNALQVSLLARHSARHVKVVLSGLGGDELFLGYRLHHFLSVGGQTSRYVPRALGRMVGAGWGEVVRRLGMLPWSEPERLGRVLGALGDWPQVYALLRNIWDDPALRHLVYGPRMLDCRPGNAVECLRALWPNHPDPVQAAAAFEWRHKMVNDLLWQEDRASMAEGLEVRVPFVDAALHARVATLSRRELMPQGRCKGFLKDSLKPLLPREILARPKSGFQVRAAEFFRSRLGSLAEEYLSPERTAAYGLFNPSFVETVRGARGDRALRWHYFMLYMMLGAHIWLELFEHQSVGDDQGRSRAA